MRKGVAVFVLSSGCIYSAYSPGELGGDHHRAVPPPGAADADGEVRLPLALHAREHEAEREVAA